MSERHLKPLVSLSVDEDSDNYSSEGDEPIGLSSIRVTVTASKKKNEKVRSSGEVQPSKMKRCRLCSEGTSTDVTLKQAEKREQIRYYWNEEEVISLLKGIIDFEDVTGMSPFDDSHGFYQYVKNSFSFEVNTKRLIDKIRHLESKYMNKGKDSFFKAHDQTCFKLAKSIWVAEGKSNEKSKKMDSLKQDDKSKVVIHGGDVTNSEWFENSFLFRSVECLGVAVKDKWSVVAIATKKKVEEKLELLKANELECKKTEEMLKSKKHECMKQKAELLNEVISVITQAN